MAHHDEQEDSFYQLLIFNFARFLGDEGFQKYWDVFTGEKDFDSLAPEDRPWLSPGANRNDYFNYGFDEKTWSVYARKLRELHKKVTNENIQTMDVTVTEPQKEARQERPSEVRPDDGDRYRDRRRERSRERDREKERERDRSRHHDRHRERSRERERDRDHRRHDYSESRRRDRSTSRRRK